jgi:hypothetical protein
VAGQGFARAGRSGCFTSHPNKINNLRALFFLERCITGWGTPTAPQHSFCA